MRHLLIGSVINILIFTLPIWQVWAITDPLSIPNNKYGIHIIDENDLSNAAILVNSSGGDWGYVTLVIREDDRNLDKWRNTFKRLYDLHLIPLVRLATRIDRDQWTKPELREAEKWNNFLNELPWPVKNRYIILFNEPNHAKEWGGNLNPVYYADIVKTYSGIFKNSSTDYFILPAGLDASAPNGSQTMDEVSFMKAVVTHMSDFENYIDGWTSHSYPNPGFMGKVSASGRGSIRSYQWEMDLLQGLGLSKTLPIFITETGWPHKIDTAYGKSYFDQEQIAKSLQIASEQVWDDPRIVAITPFVLNYQAYPFDHFSWQKKDSQEFYQQFYAYQAIKKIEGKPEKYQIDHILQNSILGLQDAKDQNSTPRREITAENFVINFLEKSNAVFDMLNKFISIGI